MYVFVTGDRLKIIKMGHYDTDQTSMFHLWFTCTLAKVWSVFK